MLGLKCQDIVNTVKCHDIAYRRFHMCSHCPDLDRLSRSFERIRLRVAAKCARKCKKRLPIHVLLIALLTPTLARIHFTDPLKRSLLAAGHSRSL